MVVSVLFALAALPGETLAAEGSRGYELVSPPDKNGNDVMQFSTRVHAAAGETPAEPMAVVFSSLGAFGDAIGTGLAVDYMAIRAGSAGTSGWTTHSIMPRQAPEPLIATSFGVTPGYMGALSPDLTSGIFRAWSPLTDDPFVDRGVNLYARTDLREPGAGSYQLVTSASGSQPPFSGDIQRPFLAGESDDGQHAIFESVLDLTADATGSSTKLYKWDAGRGVRLLARTAGCPGNSPCSAAGQGALLEHYTDRTISADGSRVIYTSPVTSFGNGTTQSSVYLFDDHGTAGIGDDSTVQVNASERTPPSGFAPARFEAASADGTRVFFTTSEALTDSAPTDNVTHLWMYDSTRPVGDRLEELDVGPDLQLTNGVAGAVGASADGHYVYFIAGGGQLVRGGPAVSDKAIYLWSDAGGAPTVSYVGGIHAPGDIPTNLNAPWGLYRRTSRVSPDGRHLLFEVTDGSELPPHADHGRCTANPNGTSVTGRCSEAYLYSVDPSTPQQPDVVCASCAPSGAPAHDNAWLDFRFGASAQDGTYHVSRALSDDGMHVFFSTQDALLPQDVNGRYDVYEYDVATRSLRLLSSGTDGADSWFMDASGDGTDAFFVTREQLVGWDIDQNYDLYDARIGGGFPEPPPAAPICSGDNCQAAIGGAPAAPSIGSATFAGAGDAAGRLRSRRPHKARRPPRCRRGYVLRKRHGKQRCVRRAKPRRARGKATGRSAR